MDTTAWALRDLAPWALGLSALCILLWVLAPLALHWGHRKPRRKVEGRDARDFRG